MRNLKFLTYSIIFLTWISSSVLAGVTPSTQTNIISQIASSTSFSSTTQNNAQNISQVQSTTSSVINGTQLRKEVKEEAKALGLQINQAALDRESGTTSSEKQMVKIGGAKNVYEGREDLKPTLNTIIYDTGLINLTKEGGNYNSDGGTAIFDATSGAQQARIKVYLDFDNYIFWGEVESKITLTGETQMTNTYKGSSAAITSLPVDKELVHTVSGTTGLSLDRTGTPSLNGNAEPFAYLKNNDDFLNSLLDANGDIASYLPASQGGAPADDLADMVKNVAHGTNGDGNVLVQARFLTAGSGTLGKSVASFEASKAASCGSSCSTSEQNTFKDSVVRYSATVETTATKYTGE